MISYKFIFKKIIILKEQSLLDFMEEVSFVKEWCLKGEGSCF